MGEGYTSLGGDQYRFPNTVWGDILAAKDRSAGDFNNKLDLLINMYWKPVYRYIRVVWHKNNEDAKDLTQEFFAKLFEKDYLRPVSPEKGKFRTFVKMALRRFLIDIGRKDHAEKRGGNARIVRFDALDMESSEPKGSVDPAEFFDQEWAKTVLTRCSAILKERLLQDGKEIYFKVFDEYNRAQETGSEITYASLSEKLDIKETDVRNFLSYTRRLLKRIITEEVGLYISDPKDAEDEIKYLLSIKF